MVGVWGPASSLYVLARCARGVYAGTGGSGVGRCFGGGSGASSELSFGCANGSGSAKSQLVSFGLCERWSGFRTGKGQSTKESERETTHTEPEFGRGLRGGKRGSKGVGTGPT